MEYKLVDYANIIKLGEYNIYIITDDIIELEVDDPIVYDILIELKKGCTENKLLKYISKNELVEFLNILIENNLLMNNYKNMYIDKLEEKQVYYFDKFNDDSNKIQEKLCGSKVAILGVGGVGSVVIQHLVASGVKEFILIDNDIVQRNNFNRQLIYNTLDIGQLKVECAKKYILSIDSSIKVTTINIMITDTTKLSFLKELKPDILVNAADRPKDINNIVNEFCLQNSLPWIGATVGVNRGTWGPLFIPNKTICFNCLEKYNKSIMSDVERLIHDKCDFITNASSGVTNTIVSTFLVQEIINFLIGKNGKEHIQYEINFDNFIINKHIYDRDLTCNCLLGK